MSQINFSEGDSVAPEKKRPALSERAVTALLLTAIVIAQATWLLAICFGAWWLVSS